MRSTSLRDAHGAYHQARCAACCLRVGAASRSTARAPLRALRCASTAFCRRTAHFLENRDLSRHATAAAGTQHVVVCAA